MGVAGRAYVGGMTVITDTTPSTTKVNGACVVAGGMGVGLSLYTGGQIVSDNDDAAAAAAITNLLVLSHSTSGTPATSIGTGISIGLQDAGALQTVGGIHLGLTAVVDASNAKLQVRTITGGTLSSVLEVTGIKGHVVATTDSSSSTTGSLVAAGGMSVGKQVYTASQFVVLSNSAPTSSVAAGATLVVGGVGVAKSFYSGSIIVVESTTVATSSTSGNLVTAGGMGVAMSLYAGGQIVSHQVDSVTNGVSNLLTLKHEATAAAAPASGIGVGISIGLEDASNLGRIGQLDTILEDVTNDSEDAKIRLHGRQHGQHVDNSRCWYNSSHVNTGHDACNGSTDYIGRGWHYEVTLQWWPASLNAI